MIQTQIRRGVACVVGCSLLAAVACQESDPGSLRTILQDGFTPAAGPSDPCIRPGEADRLAADMLESVNRERRSRNLPALKRDATLDRIADFYACRLIDGGFFSHIDPFDGSKIDSRAGDFGYAFRKIGENLGAGQLSVEQVMREWMNSPGHRDNILDPDYTQIGLAIRIGGEHGVYWVQEFGRPLTTKTAGEMIEAEPLLDDDAAPATSRPSARSDDWMIEDFGAIVASVNPF